jgi:hypothetical protein
MKTTFCPGCGVELAALDAPVHRYMESTPACWAKYGELLAREYGNAEYMASHRLTVDSYAVQHPGNPSAQSIRSAAVHLISLHAVLEQSMNDRDATALIKACADNGRFEWLVPPAARYRLNALHPLQATNATDHALAVREWALCAWEAWAPHHKQIRSWAARFRT